jgi:hypothetical protein
MKSIDALEAQFKAELVTALRRAAGGRSPTLFSLGENRARSSARSLRSKAERIMELRQSYSVDRSAVPPAADYLAACLKWEHASVRDSRSVQEAAEALLRDLERHAT